jgi:poly(U)-binding-splicing factor PUF60
MTNVDDPTASLEQQVELTLRGKDQRLMLMQKLMQRKQESKILVLRNMVGPEDVDEFLESEITGKFEKNKYYNNDYIMVNIVFRRMW